MKNKLKIPIMLILFVLMVFQLQKWGEQEYKKDSLELKNDFVLKGIVDSFQISNNHCFAVIYLSHFESNFNYFNPKKNKKYFPYAISNKGAEVYTAVCAGQIDSGDSIIIDSNKRTVFFRTKILGNHEGEINFAQGDIGYIKDKSKLFPENFLKE
ncbi:hypothetical protein [Chryseobacterium sp. JAH]|uniref:hypothetical protein n=1 Tax=Chryseobacterium sp. JAH TaxID=1742858 RepID=UPI00074133C9|nr:hypothetical protein [Chryseobacterium sp. JAH]KUJ50793.1 hypothetical protein AR685_13490 [Chryseobacterium sp. JAH]